MHAVHFYLGRFGVTLVSTCGSLAVGKAAKQTAFGKPV